MRNKSNPARFLGNFARSIFLAGLLSLCCFSSAASATTDTKTPPPHRTSQGNIPPVN